MHSDKTSDIRETYSTLVDPASIEVLVGSSVAAYRSMADYQKYGLTEYLGASIQHQIDSLRNLGRLAGRLRRVERQVTDRLGDRYNEQLRKFDLRREVAEYAAGIEASLEPKEHHQTMDLVQRYIELISEGPPPSILLRKLGTVSSGLMEITWDCVRETALTKEGRTYFEPFVAMSNPTREFLREFALYAGQSFAESRVPEDWQRPDSGKQGSIDWEDGNVSDIVKKIDFNLKKIAKGIAVVGGIAVCITGACGKIASVVTVNLVLNVISLNALFAGAALAINPDKAGQIFESLQNRTTGDRKT
jgi:hypothetical protein